MLMVKLMSWTDKKSNTSHALGTDDYIVLLGNLRYTKDWKNILKIWDVW